MGVAEHPLLLSCHVSGLASTEMPFSPSYPWLLVQAGGFFQDRFFLSCLQWHFLYLSKLFSSETSMAT